MLDLIDDYSIFRIGEDMSSPSASTAIQRIDKVFSECGMPDLLRTNSFRLGEFTWSYFT